jgi:hypothetical protein
MGGLLLNGDTSLFSDHFIDLEKSEIQLLVKENHKKFKLNTGFNNKAYNYLKYEDKIREITVLFFLTDKDRCKMVRIMSDYSNIHDLKAALNASYEQMGENKWQYKSNKKYYNVDLLEEDWYFSVTIKEKK